MESIKDVANEGWEVTDATIKELTDNKGGEDDE